MSAKKLDLLWTRLEDAKLRLDVAHSYVKEIRQDQLPSPDHDYAHRLALDAEALALKNYLRARSDFRATLASEPVFEEHRLTPREREVLTLIASGKSSKQIAELLGISFKTAVCHRYRVQQELTAHNTADLTRAALRMGLIEL